MVTKLNLSPSPIERFTMLFRLTKKNLFLSILLSISILNLNTSFASASNDDSSVKSETCEVNEKSENEYSLSISVGSSLSSKSSNSYQKIELGKVEKQYDENDSECLNSEEGSPVKVSKKAPKLANAPVISTCGATIDLTWNVATTRTNAPVDSYKIRYSSDNGLTWVNYPTTTNSTSITIANLAPGLTYLFQVSAHNRYGWGQWSPATVACVISSNVTNSYSFSVSIPNPGLLNLLPDMVFDYSTDGITAIQYPVFAVTAAETGTLSKGKYLHDLYITLKKGAAQRTFTINGIAANASAYFADSLNMGANNPTPASVGFFFSGSETYAFDIPQGSTSLSVIITN